ncbi:MAG: hypothetical protein GY869_08345 [Planctomycetes bacterium]|nr:hypothetical protein [Planctomycetota bacterium]
MKECKKEPHMFRWTIAVLLLTVGIGFAGESDRVGGVRPAPFSMDFYGYIKGAAIGDTLTILDPDGTICGEFVVKKPDQYGFLHVYGDDQSTDVDEGGNAGDELRFELNGKPLAPISGEKIYWTGDRQRQQVDFAL